MSAHTQTPAVLHATAPAGAVLTVVCLCAAWCGVCRQYRPEFEALQAKFEQLRFAWVDVEDEEELIGDVDVETFPTLLIGQGEHALFLGPLLPQIKVLERLIGSALQGLPTGAVVTPQAHALWMRMTTKWQ